MRRRHLGACGWRPGLHPPIVVKDGALRASVRGRYSGSVKPLNLGLHAISLTCIVTLGVGLFVVSRQEPLLPPPPAGAASARPDGSWKLEADLRKLQSDLDSVRTQMADLQSDRDALKARLETLRSAPASVEAPASAATLAAAFEDPKVKERLAAMVKERLEADREAQRGQWREGGRQMMDGRIQAFYDRLGVNEQQKAGLTKLSGDFRDRFEALRAQVQDKKLTPDQARDLLRRAIEETDPQLQSLLTPEQYTQYMKEAQPIRDMMIRYAFSEGGGTGFGGGRGPRERPTP